MKRLIACIIITIISIGAIGCSSSNTNVIHVATNAYFKPYEYYDEREWRALLPKNSTWDRVFISWDKNKYDINEYSKAYKKFTKPTNVYMSFSSEELANVISYIILPTENDVGKVVEFILSERNSIFGCANVPKETRVMIVSRITSFERIEKDY